MYIFCPNGDLTLQNYSFNITIKYTFSKSSLTYNINQFINGLLSSASWCYLSSELLTMISCLTEVRNWVIDVLYFLLKIDKLNSFILFNLSTVSKNFTWYMTYLMTLPELSVSRKYSMMNSNTVTILTRILASQSMLNIFVMFWWAWCFSNV